MSTRHDQPRALRYAPRPLTDPTGCDVTDARLDRPACAGRTATGAPCPHRARLGSRFCRAHGTQAPVAPIPYLAECTSARTRHPGRVHLRYVDGDSLLCTGSRAVPGLSFPATLTPCPACRSIALEAADRGEIEPDDLRRWRLGEPNVDEAR